MNAQTTKLRALRRALIEAGIRSLDQQAATLGLPRSTTHMILGGGQHKWSGLHVRLVARMLSASLPPAARQILIDYVTERSRGDYGHDKQVCDRFAARLAALRGGESEAA